MNRRLLPILALLLACRTPAVSPPQAPRPTPSRPAPPAVPSFGPEWPRLIPGVESRYFSSFDRRGGNADGFAGRYATLYRLDSGEHVIFDALGPGVLNTLWFTGPKEGGEGLDLGLLRFYFDDEKTPRIETDVPRLFGGAQPPFRKPLVADNRTSTGGFVSWVPLTYQRRLIVTTARKPSFFIAQYDTYPVGTALSSWRPGTDLSRVHDLFKKAGRRPGETALQRVPLDYSHRGAGTIETIRFKPQGSDGRPPSAEQLNQARIQIRWDGERTPSVDVPLGMFFGSGLGEARVRALAFGVEPGGVHENRLPMPFWSGFQIRVTGLPGRLGLRIDPPRFAKADAGHLHAVFHEDNPTQAGHDYQWLRHRGTGKLVGTVLTIRPPTPETKKWWEGDLRSYVDGRRTPGLHGTGHEDDHLGGWSNTFLGRPFSLPMHGEPKTEIIEREGVQHNARITLYRLWPGVHFMGAIRHSVEHGSENRVQAHYAGVAFFYARPGRPRLRQTDHLDLGDQGSRRRHRFQVRGEWKPTSLTSAFEGRGYRDPVEDTVLAHTTPASFELRATPTNRGCVLRRMYDQQVARQRANIVVNGRQLGDWYLAEGNETLRWAERDIFLPPSFTAGQAVLRIEVLPRRTGWNTAEYRLLCLEP